MKFKLLVMLIVFEGEIIPLVAIDCLQVCNNHIVRTYIVGLHS